MAAHPVLADEPFRLNLYTEDYPPWSYPAKDGVSGINVRLLQLVLHNTGYDGRFSIVPWGRAQRFTQTELDSCFFSAVRSEERENIYQWVGPLSQESVQLFSLDPAASRFTDFASVSGFRIGGQTEDAFTDYAESLGLRVERVTEIPVNLAMLQSGRIDLWLAGSVGGPFIARREGVQVFPAATTERVFELWLACNPAMPSEVIQSLNKALEALKQDGSLEAILADYR